MRRRIVDIAINAANRSQRLTAIAKLDKRQDIQALVRILNESIYKDTIEKAELALAKYSFK